MNKKQEMIQELQVHIERTKTQLWKKSLMFCLESKDLIGQLMAHFCLIEKAIREQQEKRDNE